MYYPEHFNVKEMVSQSLYCDISYRGDAWIWETLFDPRLLRMMDLLRSRFGRLVANTWAAGGPHQYRGFRSNQDGIGSRLSQHRFGRAVDLIPLDASVDDIRTEILTYPTSARYGHIGGVELEVPWLHVDVRGRHADGKVTVFKP